MNLALWIAQGLLALAFVYGGFVKAATYRYYVRSITQLGQTPVSRGLAAFIGIVEIIGAVGVVLPMAINVAPALSGAAALGLAAVMLLAMGYHLRGHEPAAAPVALFLLSAFVVAGRVFHMA